MLAHNVGEYCAVLRWGAPGSLIGIGMMRAFLPAIGAAKRLLWVSIGGVFVNGFLNYGLIHGAYGLPKSRLSRLGGSHHVHRLDDCAGADRVAASAAALPAFRHRRAARDCR